MSVIGSCDGAASHCVPSNFGASRIATSHSASFGGRTVTRNSLPPFATCARPLFALT